MNPMPKYIALLLILSGTFISGHAQVKNIKLGEMTESNRGGEPSIAINPRDPKIIVAASAPGNVYRTADGGATWEKSTLTSSFGVCGHPVVVADRKGTFYYFYSSDPTGEGRKNEKSLDQIVCHSSGDGGKTWDEGTAIGYNAPKDQDNPRVTIDEKGNLYVTWTQFDQYASTDPNCLSSIMLSRSSNGKRWSKPVQISQTPGNCAGDDQTAMGAVPAVTYDGKAFVAWANQSKIFLDRSFDGNVWLSNDIGVINQPGGWDLKVPGLDRCNGLPVLMADRSKINFHGCLYLVWADQRKGADDTDIWFVRSTNQGDYWSSPLKVNNDEGGKHQYLPWLTIDQVTGYLYVLYYDRREYDDNQTDVYLAYSMDGGASFKNVKISESPFMPSDTVPSGDYINVSAHKGVIAPVWTRMDDGKISVWTAVIRQEDLAKTK
jgi:hypothetical protein